jgi:hypothetical protein
LKIAYCILLLFIGLTGCTSATLQEEPTTLAKVGNKVLYLSEVKQTVPEYIFATDSATVVKNYIDQWIRNQVLLDEAVRLGLDRIPLIQDRINNATRDILVAELRNQIQLNSLPQSVSEEEVAQFYTTNRDMFVLNERHVKVRHLFNTNSELLETAREDLIAGTLWVEVVNKYATDVEYSLQTDKQLVAVNQAFSGQPTLKSFLGVIGLNEVSPITQEAGYYHFIQIVEDRPAGDHPELPYVFDKIQEWLKLDRSRRAFKTYEQNLLVQAEANGEIVIYSDEN